MKSFLRVNSRKKRLIAGILICGGILYVLLRGLLPRHAPPVPFPRTYVTPLHRAISTRKKMTGKDLHAMKKYIDVKDFRGQTPLMLAALRGDSGTVSLLLRHGADRYARDTDGRSALVFALYGGSPETVSLLADRKSVNVPSRDGIPPLVYARYFNNPRITGILVQNGATAGDAVNIMKSDRLWWYLWGELNSTAGARKKNSRLCNKNN